MREMLKGKIHRVHVTDANVDYEGSITVDPVLMEAADILPYEKVHVVDVTNGARLETYAIPGKPGAGDICVNGAAAHLVHPGDIAIILSYALVTDDEARRMKPHLVYVDAQNRIRQLAAVH